MPFTASHAAAILPLARTPLAPAALVIGSIAPDLPYFVPSPIRRSWTHSITGAVTIDLLICAVAFALWLLVLRAPVIDALPRVIRVRMPRRARWRTGSGLRGGLVTSGLLVAAFLIGIATHLAWDSFTHAGRLSDVFPVLRTRIVFPLYDLLHVLSSIVGAVILVLGARRWIHRTEPGSDPAFASPVQRRLAWGALVATAAAVWLLLWLPIQLGMRLPGVPILNDVDSAAAGSIGLAGQLSLALVVVWWVARAVKRPNRQRPNRERSDRAEDRDDLAEDLGVVAQDRFER